MRLLFDENLSPRLVRALALEFPKSCHVTDVGLASASDQAIWEYARTHDYAVISKDDDFRSLALVHGTPPKVICIRVGNSSTSDIEKYIRSALPLITTFELSPKESVLIL